MAKIHNGFISKEFHDSFKDTSLNDTDVATTRVYKGIKPMWKHLGFPDESFDSPSLKKYWKNIIPSDYKFKPDHVNGLQQVDVPIKQAISGSRTPRTSYRKIVIDENVAQDWRGISPYTVNTKYRYPILPKLNKFGIFDEEQVPNASLFGSKPAWNEDDDSAPITNFNDADKNLILDIDFNQPNTNEIIDKTNFNIINYNQDFQLSLDDDLRIQIDTELEDDVPEERNSRQAF